MNKKKFFSLLVVVILLVQSFSVSVFAQDDKNSTVIVEATNEKQRITSVM